MLVDLGVCSITVSPRPPSKRNQLETTPRKEPLMAAAVIAYHYGLFFPIWEGWPPRNRIGPDL
ncbi:MAG TPA: hypothetical protein DD670_05245 [Planctomycetaceae bacterium]|nr:hypothetical protein [Planctomycetaceae bacterium]